jgi:hypothetical protein
MNHTILLLILYLNHGKFIIIQGFESLTFFHSLFNLGLLCFRAIILFILPELEFNICDQMLIEQGLLSHGNSSLLIKYVTLIDIYRYCSLNSKGILYLWASISFSIIIRQNHKWYLLNNLVVISKLHLSTIDQLMIRNIFITKM